MINKEELLNAIDMNNDKIRENFAPKYDSFITVTVLHKNTPIEGITVQLKQDNVVKYTLVSDTNGHCETKVMAGTYLVHPIFDATYTTVVDDTVSAPVFGEVSAKVIGLKDGELTWSLYRDFVRNNTLLNVLAIGDEIDVIRGNETQVFQHVAYDKVQTVDTTLTHNSIIQMKDCFEGSTIQFSAPQAFIYAKEAMPAGTYHVYIYKPSNIYYLNEAFQNKYLQFTTTVDIPQGGQIVVTGGDFRNSTSFAQLSFSSYDAKGSNTRLEANIACSEGQGGTDLGQANTASNSGRVNSTDRTLYGSCYWGTSALRQWLNSDKPRGQWWTAMSVFDRKPSQADSVDGYMYGLDSELVSVLQKIKHTTTINWFDGGGTEDFEDYFIVPSNSQIYMTSSLTEGACWNYYDSQANGGFSDLTSPGTGADSNRIKKRVGSATYWWTRTPYSSYSNGEYIVHPSGASDSNYASNSYGAVPACCIA